MHFKTLLFISAITLLLCSCAKEGPQGIPGPQGDQGAAGPAGADGSVIYSGNGAPATTIGNNGDYYLDKSTGNLYGPKTSSGWGSPTALRGTASQGATGPQGPQGATGATGAPGSQIYSGSGAPGATLGNNGDYYLDKTNYFIYGPKTANGWGTPTLLRGAQGAQGPAGPAGVPGSQIYSGTGAPAANLGINGDYYLDKSTGNFYGPKTANGWGTPISLGGSGSQGPQGPAGPAGPSGPQGPAGPQGAQGTQGATGNAGTAGAAGSQIYSGSGAPASTLGIAGDYYIDDTHAIIYGPKTASGWPATGLSLQVDNAITYSFVNKVQYNLPYNWYIPGNGGLFPNTYIWLPYNNSGAQTQGFTIPQDIIDNGVVLSYIRYFNGPASDTATSAGMTPWAQMPFSIAYYDNNEQAYTTLNIATNILDNGYEIYATQYNQTFQGLVANYAFAHIPSIIRIVLIPEGQINTLQSISPDLNKLTWDQVSKVLNENNNRSFMVNNSSR